MGAGGNREGNAESDGAGTPSDEEGDQVGPMSSRRAKDKKKKRL